MSIYLRAPRSLGEGLKRVVKEAGNGTPGRLQRVVSHDISSLTRQYTNGVVISKEITGPVAIGQGQKLKAFVSGYTSEKGKFFTKNSGWINGKQKFIRSELDIFGKHTNTFKDKGKDVLKKYACIAEDALSYYKYQAQSTLNRAIKALEKAILP